MATAVCRSLVSLTYLEFREDLQWEQAYLKKAMKEIEKGSRQQVKERKYPREQVKDYAVQNTENKTQTADDRAFHPRVHCIDLESRKTVQSTDSRKGENPGKPN